MYFFWECVPAVYIHQWRWQFKIMQKYSHNSCVNIIHRKVKHTSIIIAFSTLLVQVLRIFSNDHHLIIYISLVSIFFMKCEQVSFRFAMKTDVTFEIPTLFKTILSSKIKCFFTFTRLSASPAVWYGPSCLQPPFSDFLTVVIKHPQIMKEISEWHLTMVHCKSMH